MTGLFYAHSMTTILRKLRKEQQTVTIGAALTAGHDAARRSLAGEGTVTRNYFTAFRSNFVKATGYWLIFGIAGAISVYS